MKIDNFLIVFIFNWSLWTFVKTIAIQKSLARQVEKDCAAEDPAKIINDEAESSVDLRLHKYEENLTKSDTKRNNGVDNVINNSEYKQENYQKKKERKRENSRKYRKLNKD
ncbi:unnamed protein product [Meloidogyne enterolobii]|uniref:Uncharacterized protein n=1 Tax=Meloidogyne enterolobii TaxID=390850 RepID=A0ACB0YC73_MELEN